MAQKIKLDMLDFTAIPTPPGGCIVIGMDTVDGVIKYMDENGDLFPLSGAGSSGYSGYSGQDGRGATGDSGFSGYSGQDGSEGRSGFSGYSGINRNVLGEVNFAAFQSLTGCAIGDRYYVTDYWSSHTMPAILEVRTVDMNGTPQSAYAYEASTWTI